MQFGEKKVLYTCLFVKGYNALQEMQQQQEQQRYYYYYCHHHHHLLYAGYL